MTDFAATSLIPYVPAITSGKPWCLLDCGAYRGDFAWALATACQPTRIVLIEANPALIGHLEQRFREVSDRSAVQVLNVALGPESGLATLNVYEDAATSSLLDWSPGGLATDDAAQTVKVPMTSLAEVLGEAELPVLLKVDLQGMDLRVLRSAGDLLRRKVRACVVEFIEARYYAGQGGGLETWRYMADEGFELLQIADLHSFTRGRLAFGNLLYVRRDCMAACESLDRDEAVVANEWLSPLTREYAKAAEERLELVTRLHRECELLRQQVEGLSRGRRQSTSITRRVLQRLPGALFHDWRRRDDR